MKNLAGSFLLLVLLAVAGCGGSATGTVDPSDEFTIAQVRETFERETGKSLSKVESEFGGPPYLAYDADGQTDKVNQAEAEVIEEFGAFTIYVVEEGDPDAEFDLIAGESRRDPPVRSGGDTIVYSIEVAESPDEDGVVWKEQCTSYERQTNLDTCYWTAVKRYGANVIVTWPTEQGKMDAAGRSLDEVMSSLSD